MNKCRLIVGLPGSGKTTYAEQNPSGVLFDDPARDNATFGDLRAAVASGQDVTITDTYAVDKASRALTLLALMAWNPAVQIDVLYFENDPVACLVNIIRRADDRIISPEFVQEASGRYIIPENATILPVYKK